MNEQEWAACTDPQPMLEFLRGKASDRKLRLFAVACCRRIWHLLEDERSRNAVQVAERHADGLADDRELLTAHLRAEDVAPPFVPAPWAATLTASKRADVAGTVSKDALAAAEKGAYAATGSLQRAQAAATAEGGAQCQLLRDVIGNPFRLVALAPAWLTPAVLSLAQAASENRILPSGTLDTVRLAVLADALEETGCTDADLWCHLHGPGPHVRGCFLLDRILGLS